MIRGFNDAGWWHTEWNHTYCFRVDFNAVFSRESSSSADKIGKETKLFELHCVTLNSAYIRVMRSSFLVVAPVIMFSCETFVLGSNRRITNFASEW